jgi:hypothetical protein
LFFNKGPVVEIVYLHGFLDIIQRGLGCSLGNLAALFQDVIDGRNVFLVFLPAGPDRFQFLVEDLLQELLALDISESAPLVMSLEFIQVGIFRPV